MIDLEERRRWSPTKTILLIGPGGAGKSTVGSVLAPLLDRRLIDLDQEFLRLVGNIGEFIRQSGYPAYKAQNSLLAKNIVSETTEGCVLVASSGFLANDNPESALSTNRSILVSSYSVCLLPSRDLEEAVHIVVERQLTRPFTSGRSREEARIRERYPVYAGLGDLIVFSAAPPPDIARAIAARLLPGT
ncbi:shikimate kinase [Cylindrospermopsis raciborskii CHAB3438]|nr:shikimate kinase [Cylindrospermopsis raciborskii]MCH4904899.1 shikimate kinase [Cylindrospermopsis raciborskii CHAB3438]